MAVDPLQGDELFGNPSLGSEPDAESDVVVLGLELPLERGTRLAHLVLHGIHGFLLHRYLGEVRVSGETPAGSGVVRAGHLTTHIHLETREQNPISVNRLFLFGTCGSSRRPNNDRQTPYILKSVRVSTYAQKLKLQGAGL